MTTYYFLIESTKPNLDDIRAECAAEHVANCPGTELSEVISSDMTARLIKVANTSESWKNSRTWLGDCIVVWQRGIQADDQDRLSWD
ncbi:MAG: hypothetical protein AB7F19_07755 [Candidatus Babeliales bacterium]